ncbi:hypothetical protein NO2_0417 [Candidatus Termititenax persephonae]|uniref:Uncharacterized protein n=1 Tax=Candidatus Termititenax persephonae TaxID=2218525 RepID=A0A388TFX9_9BACT|nr:hypothetical protein NO2_0417 [Candidatus Termititenax persephonae]
MAQMTLNNALAKIKTDIGDDAIASGALTATDIATAKIALTKGDATVINISLSDLQNILLKRSATHANGSTNLNNNDNNDGFSALSTETDTNSIGGLETNSEADNPVVAGMYLKHNVNTDDNVRILLMNNGTTKEAYLLKNKAVPTTRNAIAPNDKLVNLGEINTLIATALSTFSDGGLKTPVSLDKESNLPDIATAEKGDYYVIADMDVKSPDVQKQGRAWYNPDESTTDWQKIVDLVQAPDDETIVLNEDSQLAISEDLVDLIDGAVQGSQIDTSEPTASSTDNQLTSAKRLWEMFGAALSTLTTTAKTVVGAINELVSGKADKVTSATSGNFAGLDSNGNLSDSGKKTADFATASQGTKADNALQPVTNPTAGNFASLTSGGAVQDSGAKTSDFATAAQGGKADTAVQPADLAFSPIPAALLTALYAEGFNTSASGNALAAALIALANNSQYSGYVNFETKTGMNLPNTTGTGFTGTLKLYKSITGAYVRAELFMEGDRTTISIAGAWECKWLITSGNANLQTLNAYSPRGWTNLMPPTSIINPSIIWRDGTKSNLFTVSQTAANVVSFAYTAGSAWAINTAGTAISFPLFQAGTVIYDLQGINDITLTTSTFTFQPLLIGAAITIGVRITPTNGLEWCYSIDEPTVFRNIAFQKFIPVCIIDQSSILVPFDNYVNRWTANAAHTLTYFSAQVNTLT